MEQTKDRSKLINKKRALNLLLRLIEVKSVNPPGNELEAAKVIAEYPNNAGLYTKIIPISDNRANIIVKLSGKEKQRPRLIFSGHLDTVPVGNTPWMFFPFSGEMIDGKVYGRGASDMKSGVAGAIEAMVMLKESNYIPKSDIIFAGTAGEEVDCIGAKLLIENGEIDNPGAIIIAEPSNNQVFNAHKGVLWLEIKTYGKTAHGSMPREGINAIVHMNDLIQELRGFKFTSANKLLGKPTINISMIEGGVKANVVPDHCTLTLDIRTAPEIERNQVINNIRSIINKLESKFSDFHAELNIINDLPGIYSDENDEFVQKALEVARLVSGKELMVKGANYYTDGSVFAPSMNVPIIIYGPGDEKLAHQPNEYVEVENFFQAITYYFEIAKKF